MWIAGVLLLGFAWTVWPTPYRYFMAPRNRRGTMTTVRENRFTGAIDVLYLNGWRPGTFMFDASKTDDADEPK